jgi:hypothetical protein
MAYAKMTALSRIGTTHLRKVRAFLFGGMERLVLMLWASNKMGTGRSRHCEGFASK